MYGTFASLAGLGDGSAQPCKNVGSVCFDTKAAAASLPPIDSYDLSGFLLGMRQDSPRTELPLAAPNNRRDQHPNPWAGSQVDVNGLIVDERAQGSSGIWKLLTGAIPQSQWTGPRFPNATTEELGPTLIKGTGNTCGGTYPAGGTYDGCGDGYFWCGEADTEGCLFRLDTDPAEHVNLAGFPEHADRLAQMRTRAQEVGQYVMSTGMTYNSMYLAAGGGAAAPVKSCDSKQGCGFHGEACTTAKSKYSNTWGPFIEAESISGTDPLPGGGGGSQPANGGNDGDSDCTPARIQAATQGSCSLSDRTQDVNAECCDEATEDCSGGLPHSCNCGCAGVLLPFWLDCEGALGAAAQQFEGVIEMCQRVLPGGGGSTAGGGSTTAGGGSSSVVPAITLRQLAGSRLMVGTAANIARISSGAYPEYAEILGAEFSVLTPEDSMKMTQTQKAAGVWSYDAADTLVQFANTNGIMVRGHNLVWTGRNPQWIVDLAPTLTPVELNDVMLRHITNVAGHFAGQVYSWDVVNEAIENAVPVNKQNGWRSWMKTGSKASPVNWNRSMTEPEDDTTYFERAFRTAHQVDPAAKLFYNEYGIHTADGNLKYQAVVEMLQYHVDKGVPIHGIGLQMHINNDLGNKVWDPTQFRQVLTQFTQLGLEIHLTEFDVDPHDPTLAAAANPAAALADIYTGVIGVCLEL
jgi:endo-1,4-beta-xylanase